MTLFLYLAKVFICSGILFGYYRLFLRNKLFHHYNRFYLLAAQFTAILLPFVKIPVFYEPGNAVNKVVYQTIDVLTVNHWEEEAPPAVNNSLSRLFTLENGLYLLYAAGIVVLLVLVLKSLLYITKIRKQYPGETINHLKFYNTKEPGTPFSFFRSIFWNDQLQFNSREGQQIFRHELFHAQQKHSADILLAEVITALFWYNPFFYLIKKEIKAIHEFLADQYAVSDSDRYAYAELLVQQTLAAKKLSMTNHFFQNHIKRRIAMITQFKKSRYGYWSRVMVLPVSIVLFCAFSLYTHKPVEKLFTPDIDPAEPITVIIDAGHGGIDDGAAGNQFKEKDIALEISRQIEQLAPQYKVKVVMTRTGDYLPGNATEIQEGLKNRTKLITQTNAALFVSIHVSADLQNATHSGFEVYITNNNEQLKNGSTKLGMSLINAVSNLYTTKTSLMQRKKPNIWVLDQATCPAVIVECGYITNEKDVAFITNAGNQKQVAQKILEGIVAYRNSTSNALLNDENKQGSMSSTGGDAAHSFKMMQVKENNFNEGNYDAVDADKVRMLKLKMSAKAVRQILGNPNRIDLSSESESWRYGGNGYPYDLSLVFDSQNDWLIHFGYVERSEYTGSLSYEKVRTIRKNITTPGEIKKLLGAPSTIYMSEGREVWNYRSKDARLDVILIPGKGLVEYFYYSEESQEDTIPARTTIIRDTVPRTAKILRDTTAKTERIIIPDTAVAIDKNTNTEVLNEINKQIQKNHQNNKNVNTKAVNEVIQQIQKNYPQNKNSNKQIKADTIPAKEIKTSFNIKIINPQVTTFYKMDSFVVKMAPVKTFVRFDTKTKITTPVLKYDFKQGKPMYKLDINIKLKDTVPGIHNIHRKAASIPAMETDEYSG